MGVKLREHRSTSLLQQCLTRSTHADLLQVFILDVIKVGQAGHVEVVSDLQEVLLQLHFHQQLHQPFCSLLTLHATAQFLQVTRTHTENNY